MGAVSPGSHLAALLPGHRGCQRPPLGPHSRGCRWEAQRILHRRKGTASAGRRDQGPCGTPRPWRGHGQPSAQGLSSLPEQRTATTVDLSGLSRLPKTHLVNLCRHHICAVTLDPCPGLSLQICPPHCHPEDRPRGHFLSGCPVVHLRLWPLLRAVPTLGPRLGLGFQQDLTGL